MKKSVALILAGMVSLSCLVGCGDSSKDVSGTETSKADSSSSKQVGLTFSNWSGSEEGAKDTIQGMIDGFNAIADENNQVTQINWPWGDTETQLALRAQGKDQYDVAQIDMKMLPALAEAGLLADLTPIFGSDYFSTNFPEGSVNAGQYNGVQYGVPWTVAPMTMIENPTILEESGVDFEINTIADFEKACQMVKDNHPANNDDDKGNDIIPYAAMTKDAGTVGPDYQAWLWTFGANVFDENGNCVIDSENAVKCLEWFKSLKTKGYIQDAMDRGNARTLFKEGRVAFYDDAIVAKGAIYDETKGNIEDLAKPILRPVVNEGDKPISQSWGHLLVIIKRSNNTEGAKEFIEYLLSKDVALNYLDKCGMIPSKNDVLSDDIVKADYWTNAWVPALEGGKLAETCGKNAAANNQVMLDNIQAVLGDSESPEEACKIMQSSLKK